MKIFTKIYFSAFFLILAIVIPLGFSSYSANDGFKENSIDKISTEAVSETELKISMRKLWVEHIIWTRNVIFCIVDELPGKDQALKRLLRNQTDIGLVLNSYYGEDAAKKITGLLYEHVNIFAEVISEAKKANTEVLYAHRNTSKEVVKTETSGDPSILQKVDIKWLSNADEIAVFFSKANPNLELVEMKIMMHDHLKLTTDEAMQRIKKDYDSDIISYDKLQNQILKMSDVISDAIVKQFPEKFKK